MFGRFTRWIAIAAMITHVWVNLVVAPWHHLVEHRLAAIQQASDVTVSQDELKPASKCRCHHHGAAKPQALDVCGTTVPKPDHDPVAPHHSDDCQVCQVLTQAFVSSELPALELAPEKIEFAPSASAVQPWLGSLLEPVSRGPPAV